MCQLCNSGPFKAFSASAVNGEDEDIDSMRRANAYALVAEELHSWSQLTSAQLRSHVGGAPVGRTIELDGERVLIEVSVSWADASLDRIRLAAIAFGPSTWRMERVTEQLEVQLPPPDADHATG